MLRIFSIFVFLSALGGGAYYIQTKKPEVKNKIFEFVSSGQFHTLEARFTAKQIMEINKKCLLKDDKHKFLEPTLKFFPYLLMEVKYTTGTDRTGEGVILWDLTDGEMVLNTKEWDKTHGFGDCISSSTERYEFKVINLLSERGDALEREHIARILQIENAVLDLWLDSCKKKKLVVQSGNSYRLHFQDPKIHVIPETQLHDRIVTKSYKNAERVPKRFSPSQIKRISESAFGNDFAIRTTMDVFLPVYSITVQNPDGSMHTSYWNALNGKILSKGAYIH
ncbi:MAG: hypothetical protein S4CHLAM37_01530 [Chlamydiia bacterium]|nr:hypothetical protein [Chlamydiia bacterium]